MTIREFKRCFPVGTKLKITRNIKGPIDPPQNREVFKILKFEIAFLLDPEPDFDEYQLDLHGGRKISYAVLDANTILEKTDQGFLIRESKGAVIAEYELAPEEATNAS